MVTKRKLQRWITVSTYVPHVEGASEWKVYRQIREGTFPFRVKRTGRGILIDAVDVGLIEGPLNNEAQSPDEVFHDAA